MFSKKIPFTKSVAYWAAHALGVRRTCNMVNVVTAVGGAACLRAVVGGAPGGCSVVFVYKKTSQQQEWQQNRSPQQLTTRIRNSKTVINKRAVSV